MHFDFWMKNGVLRRYTGRDETVIVPAGVVEIGENAFGHCASMKHVTLPDGLKRIGALGFYRCVQLESVRLPNTAVRI